MRELTQIEYTALFGLLHREKRAEAIELYNFGNPPQEQLRAVQGRYLPHVGRELLIYRETLPPAVESHLDAFEGRLKCPYTNGFQIRA